MSEGRREATRARRGRVVPLGTTGAAVLALVVVALTVSWVDSPVRPPLAATARSASVIRAMALLRDGARPFTLTVLGDSTGDDPSEWVYLTANRLSEKYGRPVKVHNWSVLNDTYVSEHTVGDGPAAPITVWNGSASGKTAAYAVEHFTVMAPAQPDVLIVSHGHNFVDAASAVEEMTSLVDRLSTAWPVRPAVAITLQNPRLDASAQEQDAVVLALRRRFSRSALIDVYTTFESRDLALLLEPDGRHPNDAGQLVWADVVAQALGL